MELQHQNRWKFNSLSLSYGPHSVYLGYALTIYKIKINEYLDDTYMWPVWIKY